MTASAGITKAYVESILKEPIEDFEVSPGSNLGDGYTCALFSVLVRKISSPTTPVSILIKTFPQNPGKQAMLDKGGSFRIELGVYRTVVPSLMKFLTETTGETGIKPPFPGFIYGNYVPPEERSSSFKLLDNCIVMQDLRDPSNGSFRLRDRFLGFDLDHYKLVIEAQARLHAMSWSYKSKKGVRDLNEEFPCLKKDYSVSAKMWEPMILENIQLCKKYMDGNGKAIAAIERFESVFQSISGLYQSYENGQTEKGHSKDSVLRVPGPVVDNEEPWEVLRHGDAWSNNMLFRYDEKTGRPVEVIFVDLQQTKQGDPFWDVCYTLYISASPYVRREHLESMLHIYSDTFEAICSQLGASLPPGWSWTELKRRFHRAKVVGAYFSIIAMPVDLQNPYEITDLDPSVEVDQNKAPDNNKSVATDSISISQNSVLVERLGAVLEELFDDGVL